MTTSTQKLPSVSVVGLGCVGGSVYAFFKDRVQTFGYDKFKNEYNSEEAFNGVLNSDISFLCLPTLYSEELQQYDKSAIHDVCGRLSSNNYSGLVVLKSTVEPGTTQSLSKQYPGLSFVHNPEFLTARTAHQDFEKQSHVVLGKPNVVDREKFLKCERLFHHFFPKSTFSVCDSWESEAMKIFCNSFYAMKIGIFNELNLLCKSEGQSFSFVRDLMLKNKWINEMHTNVPGPDGLAGYGGMCFPKDTKALLHYMKRKNTDHAILEACDRENDEWRKDERGVFQY